MDPTELEQKMLEAAIKASLEDFQRQKQESSAQVSPSSQDQKPVAESASNSPSKGPSQKPSPPKMPNQPKASPRPTKPSKPTVVDLTHDSSSDSDLKEIFPKSKSVIGSDTDTETVDHTVDDDSDEDLRRAIAMSLKGARQDTDLLGPGSPSKPVEIPETASNATPKPQGIFGIDRKQMEQERLARLAKRKAGSSPPAQPSPKASRLTEPDARLTGRVLSPQPPSNTHIRSNFTANNSTSRVQPTARPVMQYPLGVVKKTHVAGKPRAGNDITIEEVFQREDLNVAVLSSFLWDIEWLFSKFSTKKTRFILMMGAKEEATTVFLIDLPRIELGVKVEKFDTPFKEELAYFLKASKLRDDAIKALDDFDFSQTARYAFVHTIGGSRTGESWKRSGYCGLGRAVTQLGLQPSGPINIAYVSSSVGSLNDEFLRSIYLAAKGDDGLTDYKLRYTRESTSQTNDPQRTQMVQLGQEWHNRFNVYFPSAQTVRFAHLDPERTAGTVCFSARWWLGEKFPRRVLKDCESKRGVLMHNKLMYVWPSEPIQMPDGNECKGWAYVGSANISESAWGRLIKDRSTGQPKLNCRNWECGVLVPVITPGGRAYSQASDANTTTLDTATATQSRPQQLNADIFQDTVPVPMKLPGADLTESRPPWFFQS
ncbi:hypothetical protein PENSUB_5083 [Penicillium subrubescens]|uniref:Tyrosyl-DNA phosphodiesterase 1 n=1 Tax=Penicillium subrubescens TaxID=1316194 RepID=A0A1Q5UR23_9EURO|nr:hypothetical protein PENSUB_5083 [Penicillium subrubescens]